MKKFLAILGIVMSQISYAEPLEEVTITSIRDSAAAAVEQQKNADGVTNVVAGDTVGKLPDSNIAEALQRVSGISIQRDQGGDHSEFEIHSQDPHDHRHSHHQHAT
jgi:outer membrane receptor for ferrienterochelin and colicin